MIASGCRASQAELLASLDVEGSNSKNVEHLPSVVDLLAAVVHVSESFPEGLTLSFSLSKPVFDISAALARCWSLGGTSRRLNLLDQAFVLLI